jgi:hypothetical protein
VVINSFVVNALVAFVTVNPIPFQANSAGIALLAVEERFLILINEAHELALHAENGAERFVAVFTVLLKSAQLATISTLH